MAINMYAPLRSSCCVVGQRERMLMILQRQSSNDGFWANIIEGEHSTMTDCNAKKLAKFKHVPLFVSILKRDAPLRGESAM